MRVEDTIYYCKVKKKILNNYAKLFFYSKTRFIELSRALVLSWYFIIYLEHRDLDLSSDKNYTKVLISHGNNKINLRKNARLSHNFCLNLFQDIKTKFEHLNPRMFREYCIKCKTLIKLQLNNNFWKTFIRYAQCQMIGTPNNIKSFESYKTRYPKQDNNISYKFTQEYLY
jgi:hypothetical protein